MELKTLAKNTGMLASPKVIRFIVGLGRAKLSAIFLGPDGVGVLNQIREILTRINQFSLSNIQNGFTKLIAEKNSKQEWKELASVIKTFSLIIIPIAVIIYLALLLFYGKLSELILGDAALKKYLFIGLLAFPFLFFKSISASIIIGFKRIKYLAITDLFIATVPFLFFVPLVYFFKLDGAIYYIPITFIVHFILFTFFARYKILKKIGVDIKEILLSKFNAIYFKTMMNFAGVGIITGSIATIGQLTIRANLANELGIEKIGIYAPVISWSTLFTSFIISSLRNYLFPRFSEAKDNKEIVALVNDQFRLTTFLLIPFILLVITYRKPLLLLFYSEEFLPAANYIPYHFIGLFFHSWGWALGVILQPTGRLKAFTLFRSTNQISRVAIVLALSPILGLYSWMLTYSAIPLLFFFFYIIYFKKFIQLKINKSNIIIMIYGIASAIIITILSKLEIIPYILGPLMIACLWFYLSKNEKRLILDQIKKKTNAIKKFIKK